MLITGASGFLGGYLGLLARNNWEVFGTYNLHAEMPAGIEKVHMDLRERKVLLGVLKQIQPKVIIHAAVLQLDDCERHPELAQQVNIDSTFHLSEWAAANSCRLVYVSSDMVFNGIRGMYNEEDLTDPINEYGRTKLVAERIVQEFCENSVVARLPLLYGFPAAGGTCFMADMLERLKSRKTVQVYSDQFRTPGLVQNMAESLLEIAELELCGRLHVAGSARVSRAELAKQAARHVGLEADLLQAVSMQDQPPGAPRPVDVSLDTTKARSLLRTSLLDVDNGLKRMFAEVN